MPAASHTELSVRELRPDERPWLAERLREAWGSPVVVSRGRAHDASKLPALVCEEGGAAVGIATFEVSGDELELVTIEAFDQGRGAGSLLLAAAVEESRARGCRRLWLITTNDNLRALRFYQRRGLRLAALHVGAADEARRIKPSIPLVGHHQIPIRDELELDLEL
ncbi:MAG TPA: GNAT family N-acetyltransferase [Thermoleophilaceae bacterium]